MKYFSMFFVSLVALVADGFAMASQAPADPNAPPPPAWVQFAPFIFLIVIFYFFLIRPQGRQRGERQKMLDSLKKGDKIVTQGGIIGSIVNAQNGVLEVKISEETKVKILRSAVAEIYKDEPAVPTPSSTPSPQ